MNLIHDLDYLFSTNPVILIKKKMTKEINVFVWKPDTEHRISEEKENSL